MANIFNTIRNFLGLDDTPSTFNGQSGKVVKVNATETALEFGSATGLDEFVQLTDTPADYTGQADKVVTVKPAEDGLEFTDAPAVVDEFTQLTDTPADYTGQVGKVVKVNAAEDGLEFATDAGGVTEFKQLTDTPNTYVGQAGKIPSVNVGETALEFIDAPSGGPEFIISIDYDAVGQADVKAPADIQIDSVETSNAETVNVWVNGSPYTFGNPITKFSTINTYASGITFANLNGIKS